MNFIASKFARFLCALIASFAVTIVLAQTQTQPRLYTDPIMPKSGDVVVIKGFDLGLPPGTTPMTIFHGPSQDGVGREAAPLAFDPGSLPQLAVVLGLVEPGKYRVDVYSDSHPSTTSVPLASLQFSVSDRGLLNVVEYMNVFNNDYFMTADAIEIGVLDAGTIPGWTRTGESFHAFPAEQMPSSASPVCRFYGRPEFGLDTHFFSADPWECDAVRTNWPDQWIEETQSAFGVDMDYPLLDFYHFYDIEDADCKPLYRLWNNRADAKHRYTTSGIVVEEMIAKGWILEGRFSGGGWAVYAMCALK